MVSLLINEAVARSTIQIPRASWGFAGLATPQATLLSMVYAQSTGNAKALLRCLSPQAAKHPPPTAAIAYVAFRLANARTLDILREEVIASNRVALTFHLDGQSWTGKVVLEQLGNDWKCASLP